MNVPELSSKLISVILIGAAIVVGGLGLIQLQTNDQPDPIPLSAAGSKAMDRAANRLAEPGLYVAKDVPYSRLSGTEFQALKASITGARLPLRVAVLPGSITRDDRVDPAELTKILHREVGEPGVYAVLVDDQGFARLAAAYWPTKAAAADSDATDEVRDAVAQAVQDAKECCTRDYSAAIDKLVARSMDTPSRALSMTFWLLLFIAAVVAVWWRWLRRTDPEVDDNSRDGDVVDSMAPVLLDEVSELSYRVAALPRGEDTHGEPGSAGTVQTASRTAKIRQLLTSAEARSIQLAGSRNRSLHDLVAVVQVLADLRYELGAIEALRLGRGVPTRTPPCFIDPRHGPSDATVTFAPTGLTEREAAVCSHCALEIEGGQRPAIRRLPRSVNGGVPGWANYWEADGGPAYVEGYWGEATFPDEEFESGRATVLTPRKQDPIDMLKQRLRTDRE